MIGQPASEREAWKKLQALFDAQHESLVLKDLFAQDPARFSKFSREFVSNEPPVRILLDFSKNLITEPILAALLALVRETRTERYRDKMFLGHHLNTTEDRPVLHVALRSFGEFAIPAAGVDDVGHVLARMKAFAKAVRGGAWKGYTGKTITTIVHIGIGGSDLGPAMVTEALKPYAKRDLAVHFVSNVDDTHLAEALRASDPERTLFIVASKTFATLETATNAESARDWFLAAAKDKAHVAKHFVAATANTPAAVAFGVPEQGVFQFWDWVGGRYSLWGAAGLSIALVVGYENFEQLLRGAHAMDKHFMTAPLEENLPVLLAAVGIWYGGFYGAQTQAVFPYDQSLDKFVDYLQQCDMGSNGKSVTKGGHRVNYQTSPIIWGAPGTNSQHSLFQLVHQGTQLVPADFLAPVRPALDTGAASERHHRTLLSDFFAQPEALAFGRTEDEVRRELGPALKPTESEAGLVRAQVLEGNRPSNSVMYSRLTPATLGALIALYEHKVFTQGIVWGVNSFDQMGVEFGKGLAQGVFKQLGRPADVVGHDSSTTGLIHYYQKWRGE
ncbi:glucose-6-phosphate isomerase [Trametes gibbosa]|nr:glucose-6-phosphate isomerase [Trametes gibbosa]